MKLTREARVGLLITISFTVFITFIALLAKINVSRSGYNLRIYFGFLNGLSQGAPVKIGGGISIGQVQSITQSGDKTEVKVWIKNEFRLVRTTKFSIFTTGMIGEKYINVFVPPVSSTDEFLLDGDRVYGVDPASFDQMMLTFQSFMHEESGSQMLAEIFQNSKRFVENLNNITDENRVDIRRSVLSAKSIFVLMSGQVKILMDQLNKLATNMAVISEKNKEEFSVTMRNLSEVTDSLNKIIFRLEKGRGTMGKLLTEEDIYNNLLDASVSARDLFGELKKDPSKLFFRQKKK